MRFVDYALVLMLVLGCACAVPTPTPPDPDMQDEMPGDDSDDQPPQNDPPADDPDDPDEPPPPTGPQTGWTTTLSRRAHNVSGTVTVVDEDTIRLDDFTYDGGGISVFVYLGVENTSDAFVSGLPIGPELFGTVYTGESLTIDLPPGETISNYAAVAIWCVDARVSFGSGAFTAP